MGFSCMWPPQAYIYIIQGFGVEVQRFLVKGMSSRESLVPMLTFASVFKARAGAGDLTRLRVLANCVGISFGTLDLDLLIGWPRWVVLHPFRQVF